MASHNLTGFLRDPLGEFSKGDKIRFTHLSTTGEVIKGSTSVFQVAETGEYNIDIQYGNVVIETRDRIGGKWINQGVTTINSSTVATTLPDLLNALIPASDPLILQLETILADATQAKDDAQAAASTIGSALLPNVSATITAQYSFDLMPNMGAYTAAEVSAAVANVKDMSSGGSNAVRLSAGAGGTNQGLKAIAVGQGAGNLNQGDYSVAMGTSAGQNNQANDCVSIGRNSAVNDQSSYAVAVGSSAGLTSQPEESIAIGKNTAPSAPKQIVIGSSASSVQIGDGNVQSVSDARDKYDIRDLDTGLKFINALSPKLYKYDIRELYEETVEETDEEGNVTGYKTIKHKPDGSKAGKRDHAGLIAQDVKATLDEFGIDFALFRDESIGATEAHKERASDKLALCYQELIPVLVRAVQELSAEVETLKGKK